jgi:hypothetical protein
VFEEAHPLGSGIVAQRVGQNQHYFHQAAPMLR